MFVIYVHKTKIQLVYYKGVLSLLLYVQKNIRSKYFHEIFENVQAEQFGEQYFWKNGSFWELPLPTLSLNLWFPWNFSKIKITSDLTIYQIWNDNYPLHCEKFDTWVIIPHCVHCGLTGKGFRAFFLLSNHHHWDSKPSQATAQKPLWTHCVE